MAQAKNCNGLSTYNRLKGLKINLLMSISSILIGRHITEKICEGLTENISNEQKLLMLSEEN